MCIYLEWSRENVAAVCMPIRCACPGIFHVIFTLCRTSVRLIYGTLVWFTQSSMVYNVKVFHRGDGSWLVNRLQSDLCRRVVVAQTPSGKSILSGKTIFEFLSSIVLQGSPSIIEVKAVDFWKDCKLDFVEGWSLIRCIYIRINERTAPGTVEDGTSSLAERSATRPQVEWRIAPPTNECRPNRPRSRPRVYPYIYHMMLLINLTENKLNWPVNAYRQRHFSEKHVRNTRRTPGDPDLNVWRHQNPGCWLVNSRRGVLFLDRTQKEFPRQWPLPCICVGMDGAQYTSIWLYEREYSVVNVVLSQ